MKQVLFYSLLFMVACSNSDDGSELQQTKSASTGNQQETATTASAQGGDIIGEWEMVGSVMDANDNKQIDEGERKSLKPTTIKDYMKFNSDGSGLFTVAKMEGRYEMVLNESTGKKEMTWYDKANGKHRIGKFIAVSKVELHIEEPGGSGIIVWKRL